MYYATGDSLRSVGFDGTGFTSSATVLSPLVPDWTAMAYDASSTTMFYAAGASLFFSGLAFLFAFSRKAVQGNDRSRSA